MESLLDIGARLVIARRVAGMSQREFGALIGVKQQQVARWEATRYRTASLERVDAAARALAIEPGPGPESPFAADAPASYGASHTPAITPVRDLGEIAARIRANAVELRDTYRIDRIGVFGSFACGEQTPGSDVDLLVETADPGGLRFIGAALFAEDFLGRRVELVQPDLLKERLREHVLKDAVYVWSA